MAEGGKPEAKGRPSPRKKKASRAKPAAGRAAAPDTSWSAGTRTLVRRLADLTGGVAGSAYRLGTALLLPGEPSAMRREAGAYLRELRELAGLTLSDLSDALDLSDRSALKAAEEGTAALSFELILRLSAILARHDPVPFISRMTRSYNPALWKLLEDWGVGRLPLQFERERLFVNIFRGHDAARGLSDAGFEKVLAFTRAAFELSLHFVADQEHVEDSAPGDEAGSGGGTGGSRRPTGA
jgi:transcriptional regulator with XRE-family HTH domain